MQTTTLYAIGNEYRELLDAYDNAETQEELDAIAEQLHKIDGDFTGKVRNIVALIREEQAAAEAVKAEEERLKANRQRREKRVDWLKSYVYGEMTLTGISNVDCGIAKVSVSNNRASVNVKDETLIPAEYFRVIPETKQVDKNAIFYALKSGEKIPGVELQTTTSLRIR